MSHKDLFDNPYVVEKVTSNSEKVYTSLKNYSQLKLNYFLF
ncbi:hypothetical protein GM3708_1172 [Geminocystis sp. NIES-3708]|nr:hypothetical protein [Geminocystis sp. NIES-3708]BAQ60766.1 hypothetical protein GM3708_1172 [Geminocystis sp. NIES-3708]